MAVDNAVVIISMAHDVMKLIFTVLYVSLNDGHYTLLRFFNLNP